MPGTLDLTRLHRPAYLAKIEPEIVSIPEGWFLIVKGQGAPAGEAFSRAVEALYSVSYALKFQHKAAGADFKVCPLEGRWYAGADWQSISRDEWGWELLIRQPDFIAPEMARSVTDEVARKKRLETVRQIRLERFGEEQVAQVMHIGPYSEEPATLDRLHRFIEASGYEPLGPHCEVYLSDPKRTAPDKMKTILRHAVRKRPL